MPSRIIEAADLFAGAGGASSGLTRACKRLGRRLNLRAVNHWPTAVETHRQNHPSAAHLCEDVESVNPRTCVPGGRLDVLLAGPSCTHHSTARGGKPVNDQQRSSAWCILRWATDLEVRSILIENVREFQSWGPIGSNGRPLKSRKGETFRAFIDAIKSLGYRVDWRVLNSADYGGCTTRERLFIQCKRGRRPIVWPSPSHSPRGEASLFGAMKPWRAAREVIDWSIPAPSIFGRKRPLSPNTIARIAAGLRKYGGKNAEPFLVLLRGTEKSHIASSAKSIDGPVPTLTTGRNVGLCEPFIAVVANGGDDSGRHRSIDEPLPTVTAGGNRFGLVEPFILPPEGVYRGNAARSLDDPLQTVTSRGGGQLVEPFVIPTTHRGGADRTHDLDRPLPTVTGAHRGELGLVEPFIVPTNYGERPGQSPRCHSLDSPMPTIVGTVAHGLVEPFLTKYNGTAFAQPLGEPLDTITAKDRFGLAIPTAGLVYDIRFRMLQPHELAAAMGFPADYIFTGNREQRVKQIGNAWEGALSEALCLALLEGHAA